MNKLLFLLFSLLIFFIPLILWPFTSEVFEFNKIVLTYILTAGVVSVWLIRCILERKLIFRRTILDIPLLIFLVSQIISTIISIDPLTSFFGYYSRFNGGLLSSISYCLLYWTFVSNFDAKDAIKLTHVWISSAILVSIYGVLEHFGIDKHIWVQDVQSRVFSTLGQPNWLAAWLVALIPIVWHQMIGEKKVNVKFIMSLVISLLFFTTLLFTKSRSGILGFIVADLVYWGLILLKDKKEHLKSFVISQALIVLLALIIGTQFTPSIGQYFSKEKDASTETTEKSGPALETGGTESGTIRKIVWKGAVQIWKNYPIFGTGVETFAFSYPRFRPVEHNLVSEWDFIYNKAHNEYLNLAANTGTFGLLSYLIFISFSVYFLVKSKSYSLLAGFVSLLVTNFFGFSVVPTQLALFLFPAIAVVLSVNTVESKNKHQVTTNQKILILSILLITSYLILGISKYWYSDILYTKGKANNGAGKPDVAVNYLNNTVSITPKQAIYHNEVAGSYANMAVAAHQNKNATQSASFANLALSETQTAINLAPNNPNLKRSRFGIFIMLSSINSNYLLLARDTLIDAVAYSPTDAKLYYNLGLTYARTGDLEKAISTLKTTIDLKPNYKEPRLAYALLLINKSQNAEARVHLEYILENIDPKDDLTRQTLESIK